MFAMTCCRRNIGIYRYLTGDSLIKVDLHKLLILLTKRPVKFTSVELVGGRCHRVHCHRDAASQSWLQHFGLCWGLPTVGIAPTEWGTPL